MDDTELQSSRSFLQLTFHLTFYDVDAARLVSSLAWLADEVNQDENVALQALANLVLIDFQLAEAITHLSWFRDDITLYESQALRALVVINFRLAETITRLSWFRDDITLYESQALQALMVIDFQLAEAITRLSWFRDDITLYESQALRALVVIDFQLAEAITRLSWFRDDITLYESQALRALDVFSLDHPELAKQLPSSDRFADDITVFELLALRALGEIAHRNPQLALNWGRDAISSKGDLGIHVLSSISRLVQLESDSWNQLSRQPWFVDGLDDEETAFVTVLGLAAEGNQELYHDLLQTHFTLAGSVSLPLAGDVRIWVFQTTPFPPYDDVLQTIDDTVRIAEGFMEVPFPTNEIILLIQNEIYPAHFGYFMSLPRIYTGRVWGVAHETAHYYFAYSIPGPSWLVEGGAEFMAALVNDRTGVESLSDRRSELRAAYDYCVDELRIRNLWHLDYFYGIDGICEYNMGEYFLLNVYETIGPQALAATLQDIAVSLLTSDSNDLPSGFLSDNGWERDIYHALQKHTPAERQDEFHKLYVNLHGGPYAYPDDSFSDDHGDEAAGASEIEVGEEVQGELDYRFDFDYFRFSTQEGQKYRINVNHESLHFASIALYTADDWLIPQNENWISRTSVASGPQILWIAPSSREYYFVVQNIGGETGTYTLTITPVDD